MWTAVVSSLISALYPISVPGKGCNANNNFQERTSEMISKHHILSAMPINPSGLSSAEQLHASSRFVIDERCEVHEVFDRYSLAMIARIELKWQDFAGCALG